MKPSLLFQRHISTMAMAGFGGLLFVMLASGVVADERSGCTLPESLVFGNDEEQLKFEADRKNGREATLDTIDFLTNLKWTFVPLIPSLATGTVRVHLYDAQKSEFLARYDDIDTTRFVKFFLACEDNGRYKAVPGKISKLSDEYVRDTSPTSDNWKGYVGMTFRPEGIVPDATLKGDLYAFRR